MMRKKQITGEGLFSAAILLFLSIILTDCFNDLQPSGITYRNPRVYNVHYTVEIKPDHDKPNREKDSRVWLPVPVEWASQKYVNIISIDPVPHAQHHDPEHGNAILFWDFSGEPESKTYTINLEFRLEGYEIHSDIDPEKVRNYDRSDNAYRFYTRSSRTISITPAIETLSREAISTETNPYLMVKHIYAFVKERMRFRFHDHDRGRGTESLLRYVTTDPKSGNDYYVGSDNQYAILFVAMCRAAGIPARTVQGTFGYNASVKKKDLKLVGDILISPTGTGGARHWICEETWNKPVLRPMTWAEFYIQDYGWIPVDFFHDFGHMDNWRIIFSKGTDIALGPNVPRDSSYGYGSQWVLLDDGRVDILREPVWNISRIHSANIYAYHDPDPFPADALADYLNYKNASVDRKDIFSKTRRKSILLSLYNRITRQEEPINTMSDAYRCHLFREIVGSNQFNTILSRYLALRHSSQKSVSTAKFIEIAERVYGDSLRWYFDQWQQFKAIPRFKFDSVMIEKSNIGWTVFGRIIQTGKMLFRTSVEVGIISDKNKRIHKIWLNSRVNAFKITTEHKPDGLILDPNYHILCIRKMPPHLNMVWQYYPNIALIYGSHRDAEINRSTAFQFNNQVLGLENDRIKADSSILQSDLQQDIIILFGQPRSGTIIDKIGKHFPIRLDSTLFRWNGLTYSRPAQGVMQIIENPDHPGKWMIHYTGLSGAATAQATDVITYIPELCGEAFVWDEGPFTAYDANTSYVIFACTEILDYGEWDLEGDYVWNIEE